MSSLTVSAIVKDFQTNLQRLPVKNEVACFRSLSKAISNNHTSYTKEIHGTRYQVRFRAKRLTPYRTLGRCELCDILFIVYSPKEIRIAFVQAKREYRPLTFKMCLNSFKANLEQWDLLHHQSYIKSANKKVHIPYDILKSSYKSIASFIFFHPINGTFDLIYSSASSLGIAKQNKKNDGYLKLHKYTHQPVESLHECNMNEFLLNLIGGRIGSPLNQASGSYLYSIAQFLKSEMKENESNSDLILNLLDHTSRYKPDSNKEANNPYLPRFINIVKQENLGTPNSIHFIISE